MATTTATSTTKRVATAPIRPWLGWFALSVVIGMQAGTFFRPLGGVGDTRVADWLDLLTPYAVLGTATVVLLRARASRPTWLLFGVGAVTFSLGKGMHLTANSVSNVADPTVAGAAVVHLWDEVVSHAIWFSGLFLVLLALAWALRGVAFRVGWPDLAVLATLLGLGLRWRPEPVSRLLLVVGGVGLVLLLGWGAYWVAVDGSVFPQFSELGWI
jgi:hypothetical protein